MKRNKLVISNELLAALIIIAIAISLVTTFKTAPQISGAATDTASVNITIVEVTEINFTTDSINWTAGSLTSGAAQALLNSEGTVTNGTWSSVSQGLVLENIGTENVSLRLASDKTAATFIGGTNPAFQYKITNSTPSCLGAWSPTSYTDVNATSPGTLVCDNFKAANGEDTVTIHFQLVIPSDAPGGAQTATITATYTEKTD